VDAAAARGWVGSGRGDQGDGAHALARAHDGQGSHSATKDGDEDGTHAVDSGNSGGNSGIACGGGESGGGGGGGVSAGVGSVRSTGHTGRMGRMGGTHIDSEGLCLVLGSEGRGLSDTALASCQAVSIPMPGNMESLNVGIAGGILMYLMRR